MHSFIFEIQMGETMNNYTENIKKKSTTNTLTNLQKEIELIGKPLIIETLDGKYVHIPLHDLLDSLYYSWAITRNENNYTNPWLNEQIKPKVAQTPDDEIIFTYIQEKTSIQCRIKSGSDEIKTIQTFLSMQDHFDDCLYEWTIDGIIDETTKNAILTYCWKNNNRFKKYSANSQWEIRYFHNPSAWGKLTYSLWVTICPYHSVEEIFTNTRTPSSAWASDYFCNYINTKTQDTGETEISEDDNTGNHYYDSGLPQEISMEWTNHRNIQRFLIEPHYSNLWLSKTEARINVVYDLFKYYLFYYAWNRDLAKRATMHLMTTYVDPLVNSKFDERCHTNYKVFFQWYMFPVAKPKADAFTSPLNLFRSDTNDNWFINKVLSYNEENPDEAYTKQEIKDVLIDYNIHFRKKSIDEAEKIVTWILQKHEEELINAINRSKKNSQTEEVERLQQQLLFFGKRA